MDKEQQVYKGSISFVNFEKQFATIDYEQNNKARSVNFKTSAPGNDKKPHHYRIGDVVNFKLRLSDRGDKMTAYEIKYLHNTAIDLLIQKAAIENRFSGYLKKVEDDYYVKEWDSYIFFPLVISPWEQPPVETANNEAISFRLLHLDKPNSIMAELFSHNYIPAYKVAVQHFQHKIDIPATVYKVTPFAAFLHLFDDKIQARISLPVAGRTDIKEGDIIPVLITHITTTRIVVQPVI